MHSYLCTYTHLSLCDFFTPSFDSSQTLKKTNKPRRRSPPTSLSHTAPLQCQSQCQRSGSERSDQAPKTRTCHIRRLSGPIPTFSPLPGLHPSSQCNTSLHPPFVLSNSKCTSHSVTLLLSTQCNTAQNRSTQPPVPLDFA